MLVLSRKKNEIITIGDNVEIVVVEIRGDKVRLGIAAPKEVPVHRKEIYEAIKRNEEFQETVKEISEDEAVKVIDDFVKKEMTDVKKRGI